MKIINLKPRDEFVKESVRTLLNMYPELMSQAVVNEYNKIPFNKVQMIFNILKPVIIRGLEIDYPNTEKLKEQGFKEIDHNVWHDNFVGTVTVND